MKTKVSIILVAMLLAMISWGQQLTVIENKSVLPQFEWEKGLVYEFGSIKKGTPKTAEFTFKNKGQTPLILSSVKASCGCTSLKYPQEAIAPGKTGMISATYNAASVGHFEKSVTIVANTEFAETILKIKGVVE